ncbi:MAG: hypothetical protein CMO21_06030 [Thioclava sp.]|nr:hypothetical protein [Thioclava sp.]|tara:strand:- start:45 stop:980 length:936 start_codon:yes stop_codon:yes gene_type:complete
MSENDESKSKESAPSADEIALDDIDALLDQEDPSFREELTQVASVQTDVELDEEGSLGELQDEGLNEEAEEEPKSKFKKILFNIKANLKFRFDNFKRFLSQKFFQFLLFLKTKPKEWLQYVLAQLKVVLGFFVAWKNRFAALPRKQKGIVFGVLILSVALIFMTYKNLKGVWLPTLNPPLIQSYYQVADKEHFYGGEDFELFYKAFPRDPDLFLFDKFKVNLKHSEGHRNPMGAFEVVLELDSKDAAIEVQSRQIEFHDLIQREFEDQTYPSMLTDLGKLRLKNQIKKRLDVELSQGWIEDVHFQTFILKP